MKRKIDINSIELEIDNIILVKNGIRIEWSSSIGFGQYDIFFDENKELIGRSETMDSKEDKEFLKKLLNLMVDKINIVS